MGTSTEGRGTAERVEGAYSFIFYASMWITGAEAAGSPLATRSISARKVPRCWRSRSISCNNFR